MLNVAAEGAHIFSFEYLLGGFDGRVTQTRIAAEVQ